MWTVKGELAVRSALLMPCLRLHVHDSAAVRAPMH